VLKGYLLAACGREVNQVNAPALAANLGIKVTESRVSAPGEFTDLIEISAGCNGDAVSVAGTFFGSTPRLVKINNRHVEAKPEGVLLVLENRDRPGIVGMLGSMLGAAKVNIAGMSLSRNEAGGEALTVLNLDTPPSEAVLDTLLAEADIHTAQVIQL
jgi:D-3-phosphoglycerate dehydrogenase